MIAGDGKTNVTFFWATKDGTLPSIAPPAPVIATARARFDQLLLGGTPHGAWFVIDYGNDKYECHVREDRIGGYKVLILVGGGCIDRRSFLLLFDGVPDPNEYYASRPTGLVEKIDPTDGLPRPTPIDPATFTKRYKVPNELRAPPVGVDPSRAPGGYRRTSSMFSGQMRMVVGCFHLGGKDAPFGFTYAKTHGLVEFPQVRTADGNGKLPPGKRFWIVEISPLGVFAMPVFYRQKCCEFADQIKKAQPTDAEIAANPLLAAFKTELDLAWAFTAKPNANIVQLINAASMAVVYAKGSPMALAHGWAFSYSGHEASNIVFTPHNNPDNYWEIWHPRISFTTANPSPGVFTIVAAADYLVSDFRLHNNVTTLVWFQSETYPGEYEQFFPYSFNGGTTLPSANYSNAPIYVFYRGDTRHVLRMSSVFTAPGSFSPYSDPAFGSCADTFGVGAWGQAGVATRVRFNVVGGFTSSMSFAGGSVSALQGSTTVQTYTATAPTLCRYQKQGGGATPACGCDGLPGFSEGWLEDWCNIAGFNQTDATNSGGTAAVLSFGDRESLFLIQKESAVGSVTSYTRAAEHRRQSWELCYQSGPGSGLIDGNFYPSLPGGDRCRQVNVVFPTDCIPGLSFYTGPQIDNNFSFPLTVTLSGSGHIGGNDIGLAPTADIGKFTTAKNPALLQPTYSPGPIGWHGNMQYNEPTLIKEGVTNPVIDYVFTDGTAPYVTSGGFSLLKPPSGPALGPLAFVGRV